MRAWLAAAGLAIALTGCGGGSDGAAGPAAASAGSTVSSGSSSSVSSSSSSDSAGSSSSSSSSGSSPPVGSNDVTLNWSEPTENTDGSAIAGVSGYKILFGQSANALDESVAIDDPATTSYTIQNLPSGTWYFAVVTVAGAQDESAPTNVVSATL